MVTKKGSGKNDHLTGSTGDDFLFGLDGNDTLDGGKGNDDLIGGAGNDRFVVNWSGEDNIDGGSGVDTIDFSKMEDPTSGAFVTFSGFGRGTTSKNGSLDSFKRIENIIGSNQTDNILSNDKGIAGYVYGGGGTDKLCNPGGTIRGDAGNDFLIADAAHQTSDTLWLQRGKGVDSVANFDTNEDVLLLSHKEFALGPFVSASEVIFTNIAAPVGTRAQLIFEIGSSRLYYDPDGTGSAQTEYIADFDNNTNINWYDFEII